MSPDTDPFASTYAQARARFRAAAQAAGAMLQAHPEPGRGAGMEVLAMDVARLGADDADAVLLVSSGCHGVEGHCGSGLQVALLGDAALLADAQRAGVALVLVHALNPWGFSHGRRVTQEGVDLNRNFIDFRRPPPRNAGYDELADALLPADWPPPGDAERRIAAYGARHGMAALQQAISGGQYAHPDGLFHGGTAPTWSHQTLRLVLRQHGTRCRRLGWIDLHSGLGESGVGERIHAARSDDVTRQRAKAWWGNRVTFTDDGSSVSSDLLGNAWHAAYEECAQATYTGIALEFGTVPLTAVLQALRLDHWVARRHDALDPRRETARAAMREAFYTDTPEWKRAVLAQGREATAQAIAGLAGR
ncbi:MAG: M14 family metallopeptidase [Burkholderiaceae bacterium]